MKVTRGSVIFEPVTIVLENEREADLIWHTLNNSIGCTLEDYMRQKDYIHRDSGWKKLHNDMFWVYDKTHTAKKEDC